jgi:hypothetical protein
MAAPVEPRRFEFDFRYYNPYIRDKYVGSGLYVFKTSDRDSIPFPHRIISVQAYQG